MYVRTQALWNEIEKLSYLPGVEGGTFTHAPAKDLSDLLERSFDGGDLVNGTYLEQVFEYGNPFLVDTTVALTLQPELNLDDLDRDHIHAFLCAYAAAFHG
jgi:hypothetical protein